MPVYLRKVEEGGVQARSDTVNNTERGINMRSKHASSRLRVPHIHPGYVLSHTGCIYCLKEGCGSHLFTASAYCQEDTVLSVPFGSVGSYVSGTLSQRLQGRLQ